MATTIHESDPVTLKQCEEKRNTCRAERTVNKRWLITIVVGVLLACGAGIVAAATSGYAAMHRIDMHEARQAGTLETIDHRLIDLARQIEKLDAKQTTQQQEIVELLRNSQPTP